MQVLKLEGYIMEQAQQSQNHSSTALSSPAIPTGSGIFSEPEQERFLVSTAWLAKYGLDHSKLIRFKVNGHSMEPVIAHGSWIMVDTSNTAVEDGFPYLFRFGDRYAVAYLFQAPGGGFVVRSHDPAEPDSIVTAGDMEDFVVIGRVVESTRVWIKPADEEVGHDRVC